MKPIKIKTSKAIGTLIKRRRREVGLSQEKLSELMGVTYQQVQRYENGTNKLNVENIQIVAHALEVPVTFFFEDVSVPYVSQEERKLLKSYRAIKDSKAREAVIEVARLVENK